MFCLIPAMMTLLPDVKGISIHGSLDKRLPEWDNHNHRHLHCDIVSLKSGTLHTNVEVFDEISRSVL